LLKKIEKIDEMKILSFKDTYPMLIW